MLFWNILILLIMSCNAKTTHIKIGAKVQPTKGFFEFQTTYIKFHYVLRCPKGDFEYKIDLIEYDDIIDDYLESQSGKATDEVYGLIDTWDKTDLSDHFEFTVKIRHNCRGTEEEDEWKELMKCPTKNLQCQFYFDVNLVTWVDVRHKCNEGGYCDVIVDDVDDK